MAPIRIQPRPVGAALLAGLLAFLALAGPRLTSSAAADDGTAVPLHEQSALPIALAHKSHSHGDDAHGFTDGWLDGQTVQFFYTKDFFCAQPPPSGATSQCEVGAEGTVDPRPGNIPTLWVMTPVGFRPPDATLHCPQVGFCINHPSTIDTSRVFGAGHENDPLPAHSHIVAVDQAGWWELVVIGVKDEATWDQVVAGKSLATVRALQAADPTGAHITGDIPTNTYLFFSVQT
jgi:hypothetical protein